jgi:hypothetical protein
MMNSIRTLFLRIVEKFRTNKGPMIGGTIAVVFVIAGLSSWAVYALWYQSPDKVVADALTNALSAKTMTFKATASGNSKSGNKDNFELSGKSSYEQGASVSLRFEEKEANTTKITDVEVDSIVTPSGDGYVRVGNLQALSAQLIDELVKTTTDDASLQPQVEALYKGILEPIFIGVDSKWIKFSSDDLKHLDAKSGEEYECIQTTLESVAGRGDLMQEIGGRYYDNKFIKIQKNLGTVNGKMGYVIAIDSSAVQTFIGSLKTTKLYKELGKCSPKGANPLDLDITEFKDALNSASIELWVDQWTHQIATMQVKLSDNYVYDVTMQFNTPVEIKVPKEATPFNDIIPGLGQIFGGDSSESLSPTLFSDMI